MSTGVIRHLKQDDYICSTYRDHVHALSKARSASPKCLPMPVAAGQGRGQGLVRQVALSFLTMG